MPEWEIEGLKATIKRLSKETEALNAEVNRLRVGLEVLTIGSCNCLTKTPDHEYHQGHCLYKKLKALNHKEG